MSTEFRPFPTIEQIVTHNGVWQRVGMGLCHIWIDSDGSERGWNISASHVERPTNGMGWFICGSDKLDCRPIKSDGTPRDWSELEQVEYRLGCPSIDAVRKALELNCYWLSEDSSVCKYRFVINDNVICADCPPFRSDDSMSPFTHFCSKVVNNIINGIYADKAKSIPSDGFWIQFDSEDNNALYMPIDAELKPITWNTLTISGIPIPLYQVGDEDGNE